LCVAIFVLVFAVVFVVVAAVLVAVISFLLIRLVLLLKWPRIWNYHVFTQVPIMLKCFQFS